MDDLPENSALDAISEALAAAVRAPAAGGDEGAMLMVVQPGERNAFDQQWLQAKLWDSHRIRTIRKSLAEVAECATTDASGGLWIVGQRVTVAYFRAGYTPTDYPSEKEWEGRLLLEKSSAIKCPNMAYHLAGTKKVQQDLTRPGVLERFLPPEDAAAMRGSFTGLWGLAAGVDEGVEEALAMALADPGAFVLKPQREGGGNNLYGDEMCERLKSPEGLDAFILMQLIRPPKQPALMLREGKCIEVRHPTSAFSLRSPPNLTPVVCLTQYPMGWLSRCRACRSWAFTRRIYGWVATCASANRRDTCCGPRRRTPTRAAWLRASPCLIARDLYDRENSRSYMRSMLRILNEIEGVHGSF